MDCSVRLFTHQINSCISSSYSSWNGPLLMSPSYLSIQVKYKLIIWDSKSSVVWPQPISPALISHSNPICVYCCSCTWHFLHFSHAFSFLFFLSISFSSIIQGRNVLKDMIEFHGFLSFIACLLSVFWASSGSNGKHSQPEPSVSLLTEW